MRGFSEKISRIVSKQNLNTVIETTQRKKNRNKLFDRFWYQTREARFLNNPYDGLHVDMLNLVAYQENISQYLKDKNQR